MGMQKLPVKFCCGSLIYWRGCFFPKWNEWDKADNREVVKNDSLNSVKLNYLRFETVHETLILYYWLRYERIWIMSIFLKDSYKFTYWVLTFIYYCNSDMIMYINIFVFMLINFYGFLRLRSCSPCMTSCHD